tara:strand:- start:653 stop:796 length:144 start_codon:yes stop_codon:yes gene_type:complete
MRKIKLKEKNISKNKINTNSREPSGLLADFFNGIVIEFVEEYLYETK